MKIQHIMHIYDSLTATTKEFTPIITGKVSMYVCGVTVYADCHIGHARSATVFDMIRKWLIVSGYEVTFVQNVTDIDDKIIDRAVQDGVSIKNVADKYENSMRDDFSKLKILPPTMSPKATRFVPSMLKMIDNLVKQGDAYVVDDGVKFNNDGDDFYLWKAAKPHEPSDAIYPSVFGNGRPGWHIECSAMCQSILGDTIDIHGGGMDLKFPHHQNERHQSETLSGKPLANYWMHNGSVNINGAKMSKSVGNFITIKQLLEKYSPEVIRYYFLNTHYASPIDFTWDAIEAAKRSLVTLALKVTGNGCEPNFEQGVAKRVKHHMDTDFNTVNAISELHTSTEYPTVKAIMGIMGIYPNGQMSVSEHAILKQRDMARMEKNWNLADTMKAQLLESGVYINDTNEGTKWIKL